MVSDLNERAIVNVKRIFFGCVFDFLPVHDSKVKSSYVSCADSIETDVNGDCHDHLGTEFMIKMVPEHKI